jgi:hypothetical protein
MANFLVPAAQVSEMINVHLSYDCSGMKVGMGVEQSKLQWYIESEIKINSSQL